MLSILTGLFSGPLIGLLGGAVTAFVNYKNRQLDIDEKREERKHELALYDKQAEFKAREMEHELDVTQLKTLADMRAASYQQDASYGQPTGWAVNALRFFRPGLTALLVLVIVLFWFTLGDDVSIDGLTLKQKIVITTLDLTGMAFAWWFGDRQISKRLEKQ